MLRFYTNQELARRLRLPTAKWKRWSREFLPPDPLGGLQSGYARQYSVDDALTVFLGGVLVADLKFVIPEARQILSDLNSWLLQSGIFTGVVSKNQAESISWSRVRDLSIEICRMPSGPDRIPVFRYRLRGLLERHRVEDAVAEERFVERLLPDGPPAPERFRGALLRVTDALRWFVGALELDRRHFAALREDTKSTQD